MVRKMSEYRGLRDYKVKPKSKAYVDYGSGFKLSDEDAVQFVKCLKEDHISGEIDICVMLNSRYGETQERNNRIAELRKEYEAL